MTFDVSLDHVTLVLSFSYLGAVSINDYNKIVKVSLG